MFENIRLEQYLLDDFTGEVEIAIDSIYDISEDKIHQFTFKSGSQQDDIYAIYIGDTNNISTDTIIMYCHGNYGHMDYYWTREKLLANIGEKYQYGVLMIDYKGYGKSTGNSTEYGLVEDVNNALYWLKEKGLTNDRLILYGYSLGSYPAAYLSSVKDGHLIPHKLILESPLASTEVMVNDASKLSISNKYFTTTDYENAELIKNVEQDFLWIHGKEDAFLNIETHGEVVYKNYRGNNGTAIRVDNGAHSNVPTVYGYVNYLNALESFIKK